MSVSRRTVLNALGATAAGLLLERRISAAGMFAGDAGTPGALDLKLIARSEHTLHIGIAPVIAMPADDRELGVVPHTGRPLQPPGLAKSQTIA